MPKGIYKHNPQTQASKEKISNTMKGRPPNNKNKGEIAIKKICECGKEFYTSRKKQIFCSNKCRSTARITKIKKECLICKKAFLTIPSQDGKYCSCKCYHLSMIGRRLSKKTVEKMKTKRHERIGRKNPTWKGGRLMNWRGYISIYFPEHPFCQSKGYVFEHRLIMEKHLGRYLTSEEVIHHINGIKSDNRLENLMYFTSASAHRKFHLSEFLNI